jgi:RNA polymerase sigma factor (sigma-70 family)
MLSRQQKVILPHLCRLIGSQFGGALSDRDLLGRFVGEGDADAFAALVRRHGSTVLGVCRRILGNAHDAEDAFQATFLVLARKARSVAKQDSLGSYLYGVAYRVALKSRAEAVRRRQRERQAAVKAAARGNHDPTADDLRPILDEEVNRLPEKYRRPIVLCYFEGKTYQEAARLLGWPAGTAAVRLARARALLRSRLALRGLAPAVGALAALLAECTASAADVSLLAEATAGAAVRFAAGAAAAGISSRVIALTEGVVKAMLVRKIKTVAGVLLAVGLTCAGAGALRHFAAPAPAAAAEPPRAAAATGDPLPAAEEPPDAAPASPPRAIAPPAADGARPAQTRIGLINITRVLKDSKKTQALQKDLRKQTQAVQERLEALRTQARNLQAEHNANATPVERREQLGRQLKEIARKMEDEEQAARKEVERRTGAALTGMYRAVEDAARRVANLKGLELVLFYTDAVTEADFYNPNNLQHKLSQPGALMPMIVAPGMDVTDTVLEALNRAHAPPDDPRR